MKNLPNIPIPITILALILTVVLLLFVIFFIPKSPESPETLIIPEVDAAEYEVLGGEGEVSLTLTTTVEKWNAFKVGFLKVNPLPDGMSEGKWVKKFIKQKLMREYQVGMKRIHEEGLPVMEGDIFE